MGSVSGVLTGLTGSNMMYSKLQIAALGLLFLDEFLTYPLMSIHPSTNVWSLLIL